MVSGVPSTASSESGLPLWGVIDRQDGDCHLSGVATTSAVRNSVGEVVAAVEVLIRCVSVGAITVVAEASPCQAG